MRRSSLRRQYTFAQYLVLWKQCGQAPFEQEDPSIWKKDLYFQRIGLSELFPVGTRVWKTQQDGVEKTDWQCGWSWHCQSVPRGYHKIAAED